MAGLHGDELGQLSDTARKVIRRNHRAGTSGCSLSFVHIRHLYAEPTGIYQSESDSDSEQYPDEYRKGAAHVHSCRKGKPIENYSSQGFEERYLAKGRKYDNHGPELPECETLESGFPASVRLPGRTQIG